MATRIVLPTRATVARPMVSARTLELLNLVDIPEKKRTDANRTVARIQLSLF